jgi:hypothetical protein
MWNAYGAASCAAPAWALLFLSRHAGWTIQVHWT